MDVIIEGPQCPRCGTPNDVWMFRRHSPGLWYKYTCAHCEQVYEWRRMAVVWWEVREKYCGRRAACATHNGVRDIVSIVAAT